VALLSFFELRRVWSLLVLSFLWCDESGLKSGEATYNGDSDYKLSFSAWSL